jgi:hypothetical protein
MSSVALQIDPFVNTRAPKYMVAAADAFFKTEPAQETAEILEIDTRIGCAQKDLVEQLPVPGHIAILLFPLRKSCAA